MIISPARKYIFVHIPKTGGTSLTLALEDRAKRGDIIISDTPKGKRRRQRVKKFQEQTDKRLWKHSTLADLESIVTPEEMREYFVFAMVRNPWDRLVSYYHWLRMQNFEHRMVRLAKMTTFQTFVTHVYTQKQMLAWPYSKYTMGSDGTQYATKFIRLEQWRPDMSGLIEHLGFTPGIGRTNRSLRHPDYRTYYTDETAELVSNICARDIQQFGYRF